MNILVVDDEPMIREAVASYLEKQGYHVFLAETGKAAFEVFEREKIAFIVLDLMLPDISGEELCAEIRRRSRVPIIMLTARTMEEDMLNGLKIGADDYITKPFEKSVCPHSGGSSENSGRGSTGRTEIYFPGWGACDRL